MAKEGDNTQPGSPGLGSLIFKALGKSDRQPGESDIADPTHIIPVPKSGIARVTVGGQILSISPKGVYLSGTSYLPGGPAITLSGAVFSLVSNSPAQEANDLDEDPRANKQPFSPSVQTIAGPQSDIKYIRSVSCRLKPFSRERRNHRFE